MIARVLLALAPWLLLCSSILLITQSVVAQEPKIIQHLVGGDDASEGCLTVYYQALLACKADYRILAQQLQLHTEHCSTGQHLPHRWHLGAFMLLMTGYLAAALMYYYNSSRLLQHSVAQCHEQLEASAQQHDQEMEEARAALKRARAETRMLTRHHANKFHLPDPHHYQKRFTSLLHATRNNGFQEADSLLAQLLHVMYKLAKLQVLYEYLYEVLQMLPIPSIHADDDTIPQKDNAASPSPATQEAMRGKICQLDQDLDKAVQKYLDSIAEPSILNSLEPRWYLAASQKYHELVPSLDSCQE